MDDAKLSALFRKKTANGSKPLIDTTDLNVKTVKAVNDKYFPDKIYKNFGPVYRKKARAWNLAQELSGSRKKTHEESATSVDIGDEEEEDEDYELEADEDIDNEELDGLFDDAEKEPVEAVQSSLASLSISKKSAKMSARKEAASAVSGSDFCMDFKYPYLIYQYTADGFNWVSVDFLVPTQSEDRFRLAVRNGNILSLGTVVPQIFISEDRIQQAHEDDQDFNKNTHKATAQSAICEKVGKAYENEHTDDIIGKPQLVKLPIEVEDDIANWECQLFASDELEFQETIQADVYYNVLSVDLKSIEKKKKKVKGKVRIVGSPQLIADAVEGGDAAMGE